MRKPLEIHYMEIIKDSLRLVWKRRYLWWFGFFAAAINGGGINFYTNFGTPSGPRNFKWPQTNFYEFVSSHLQLTVAIVILAIILIAVLIVLGFWARGALISSLEKEIDGKNATFKSGTLDGRKNFWKIFMISVTIGLFLVAFSILICAPIFFLFYSKSYVAGMLMSFIGLLILLPLIILTSFLRIYGYLYSVIGKLNFWPAIEKAYWLFRNNFWASIVMGLLFFALNFLTGVAILMAMIPIAIVFFAFGLLLYLIAGHIGATIVAIAGALAVVISAAVIRAVYEVFAQSVWIMFFHEIAKAPEEETATEPKTSPIPEKPMPIIETER